jgi:hypothetical protein
MLPPGTKINRNKNKVTGMNLDDDILNHYIFSFFLSFLLYSSLLPASKSKHKEEISQGSNTSGSKKLKETLLIIINSQAYHHESPAKISARDQTGRANKPAQQAAQSPYACIEVSRHQ